MNTFKKYKTQTAKQAYPLDLVVLISGSGSNLQAIIDHIQEGKLDARISAVISDKEGAYGLVRARNASIPTTTCCLQHFSSKQEYERELANLISQYQPDLLVLAGFMKILSADFIEGFPSRILNIHPSLLPKFKGLSTHQRAINAGEVSHGATVHIVTPDLDSGPIVLQSEVIIDDDDDAEILGKKVLKKEHMLYSRAIQYFADNPGILGKGTTFPIQTYISPE